MLRLILSNSHAVCCGMLLNASSACLGNFMILICLKTEACYRILLNSVFVILNFVDVVRRTPANKTTRDRTEVMLYKYYPASSKDNFIVKYHHTLETFPQSWLVPSAIINFHGVDVSPERLVAVRIPLHFRDKKCQDLFFCLVSI